MSKDSLHRQIKMVENFAPMILSGSFWNQLNSLLVMY